jgi:predicted alpha/beta-fold hydrolase
MSINQQLWPPEYPVFMPRRWFTNPHLQTIVGNFLPRKSTLPKPIQQLVEVTPAHGHQISTQVLCECHWQPENVRASRPAIIILHGLEGSSHSHYVIGNANKLWRAGCNVIRMNMRNCAGTEKLTPTLYHSGLSGDVGAVMHFFIESQCLQSISLIGYSMGGNLVLKLAGDQGTAPPPQLRCVVGVSPAVDLAASADALHEPQNRIYEHKFLRALLKRFRRKSMLFPRAFDPQMGAHITSLREFDDRITALYCGFRSADDYYYRAAAARVLDRITIPTLIIHAVDDPFVRLIPSTRETIAANPNITLLETEHGGHCAFLATPDPATNNDGYWAEHVAMQFILDQSK